MTSPLPALALHRVCKHFGEKRAVDDLSLTLAQGATLGLLGRNGAGKSTTIKMATGLLTPTSGSIRILGTDLATDPMTVKRQIGAMPEDMALLDMLTGRQYLRFVGRMYGMDDAIIDRRAAELFETLDLAPGAKTLISEYSFGMKKKVALCAALIHGPKVLFLDEPFEGIDAVTNRTIKDILQKLGARGVTIVLTSHILEVVERICPLIAVIDGGALKAFGPLEELQRGRDGLEALFVDLVGGARSGDLSWL
jgi:ABC-2 type transport system ATP-binding protein